MDHRSKCKTKATEPTGENMWVNLHDLELHNSFLDLASEAQARKETIYKLDFIKIKKVCASRDSIKKVKRQSYSTEWDKIFANHTDKIHAFETCNELSKLQKRKNKRKRIQF